MKRPFLFQRNLTTPPPSFLALLGVFLFFVLGCSVLNRGSEPPPAEGAALVAGQQASLVCSQSCADRGQCGYLLNNSQPVILAYSEGPALENPQMIFPADTVLPLLGVKDVLLQVAATNEQFTHPFYFIQRSDGAAGWIAGWCVNLQ